MSTSQLVPFRQGIALSRSTSGKRTPQSKMVEGLVQPEVWTMYDTYILGAANTADSNLGSLPSNGILTLFNSHTIGSRGEAITSMTTNSGYVDFPFKAYGVGVEVFSDNDAQLAATNGVPPSLAWVEALTQYAALTLKFATDTKFIMPISDLPAGGGVSYGPRISTQAAAASFQVGGGTNGLPTVQARALWKDYILFRGKDAPFSCYITIQAEALAKLNALTALASHVQMGVRVKFWGYRGKSLVTGAPFRG